MRFEIRLVKDGDVVLTVPVPTKTLEVERGSLEVSERDLERLWAFYSIGSNRKRLRVMMGLLREGELRFSDIMQIATNPKLAQDCLQPMLKQGLVVHEGRGSAYKISDRALPLMITLTVGLARMLATIDRELAKETGRRPA